MKRLLIFAGGFIFSLFSPWWASFILIFILAVIFGFPELIFLGLILDFSFGYGGIISNSLLSISILLAIIINRVLKPHIRLSS